MSTLPKHVLSMSTNKLRAYAENSIPHGTLWKPRILAELADTVPDRWTWRDTKSADCSETHGARWGYTNERAALLAGIAHGRNATWTPKPGDLVPGPEPKPTPDPLRAALLRLLGAPALNMDELEPEDRAAIDQATKALGLD